MMEQHLSLLERYRRDRRQLIEFLLSSGSGLIKELRPPSGSLSNIDFDTLSADYIIHCLKSGTPLLSFELICCPLFGCLENYEGK